MRVLYLTDSLSDLDGVGQYSMRLIDGLQRLEPSLEAEVLLARKHRPTSAEADGRWPVRVTLPPDYFYYMSPARFGASLALAVVKSLPAARRADLIHAIKDYPHNLVAVLLARLARKPCVATAHGTYTVQPLLSARHRRMARWTYARFAALISVSAHTKKRVFEALGADAGELDEARVHVIPNAVSAAHYAQAPDIGERPWQAAPYVLSIAEVKERKGLHLAVEAFARVAKERTDLHHWIIGKATGDEYQERLRQMARVAGVEDRQHFLGNVDEAEKIDLLRRAEVFLHTPVRAADGGFEGFGIVYLEAAASGTPSIGTLDCGAEDAIRDRETGLLVPPDAESVTAGLERLMSQPELRERLGRAGPAVARACNWETNARRVLDVYRGALG